jgi:hypothetical protein
MSIIKKLLLALIEGSRVLGLGEEDLRSAKEFLENHEFGLCFDTIITQMYENDIEIDNEFYEMISKIAYKMNLPMEGYSFMKELIRSGSYIPKPVREELARIIKGLEDGV